MKVTNKIVDETEKTAEYDGALDEHLMRQGFGIEIYRKKPGNEHYKGHFNNDAYHGLGCYKNDSIFNKKWTYEGSFFSNVKEGYGQLSLPDNIYFEGLYENDRPFGPGILTRSDGKQDVGFWQSSSIVRLIQSVPCEVEELSTTPVYRAFMAKFKKIVEVAPPNSVALHVAKDVNLPEELAPKLYSIYCKDPRNFLFNYEQFEREYFDDLKKIGDLLESLSEDDYYPSVTGQEVIENKKYGEITQNNSSIQQSPEANELTVIDINTTWDKIRKRINLLLAWNNTPIMIDIMVHTFINRIYEKHAGFNVVDLICNKRQQFRDAGPLEEACRSLLESSNTGNLREFTRLLLSNKLNINLQDSKGNGCVIRAASQDRHPLLYLLFLYGANMNIENDEGFTALNHTITRYLALLRGVGDWGKAFLPPLPALIKPVNGRVWRKCSALPEKKSARILVRRRSKSKSPSVSHNYDTHRRQESDSKSYIFDLSPSSVVQRKQSLSTKKKPGSPKHAISPSRSKRSSKKTHSEANSEVEREEQEASKKQRLENVFQTLQLLLTFKINPNASRVPQPAVILAVFTGDYDLVKMLLEAGADPNARFLPEEGWLTPLHVLCLAKPHHNFPEIMDILLEYGADPNAQASIDFSPNTKEFILQSRSEQYFEATGLTPLQALLLRPDGNYLPHKEILKELLLKLHDITARDPKYYGHSFLSMAIIRMNLPFIFTLLHIFGEDPNEYLHEQWGNIATAFLTYLGSTKDPEAIIALIELEQAGLNPLLIVDTIESIDEGNTINFALNMANISSRRKTSRTVTVNRKSQHKKTKRDSKLVGLQRKSMLAERDSADHRNRSVMTRNSGTRKSTKVSTVSRSGNVKRRPEKELLKKITLLQDLGRDKVDKYIRGLVMRRLISYLRRKTTAGEAIKEDDSAIQQAINWFHPTTFSIEEEFLRILTHNILAGLTFISSQEVEQMFSIIQWEAKEPPEPQLKIPPNKYSLKPTEKVLLRHLKDVIRSQLDDGVSIDRLNLNKKKLRKSSPDLKSRQNSRASMITGRSQMSNSTPSHHHNSVKSTVGSRATSQLQENLQGKPEEIEENEFLLAERISQQKREEFIEKLKPLLTMCLPQVRWARNYGTKYIRIPKREKFNTDLYPEVDKNQHLYTVCYKCVKRDPELQLCPMCKMVWYCSSKCNVRDILNRNSNHRCKADFFGRGADWKRYGFDENGNIIRIPREGQEDWEEDDRANDGLLKKFGKKATMKEYGTHRDTFLSGNVDGRSERPSDGTFGRRSGASGKRGTHGSSRGDRASEKYRGPQEMDRKGNKSKWEKDKQRGRIEARLREKREKQQLLLQEARRMREMRKKMPHGVMGDFMRWGFVAMKRVSGKSWYKKLSDRGGKYKLDGETAEATLSDERIQLIHQLQVLQGLAALFGSKFNLTTLFPWVVLRDGELYYKFNSTPFVLENYSFN